MYISGIDDEDDMRVSGAALLPAQPVHVTELAEAERTLIQATEAAALSSIPSTNPQGAPSLEGRVAPMDLKAANDQIRSVIADLEAEKGRIEAASIEGPFVFLNLNPALDLVNVGLLKEQQVDSQLQQHIKKIEKQQKTIDLLIKLNTALSSQKEGEELSEEMKGVVAELKKDGIDLLKEGETTLSKERITELKPVISSHTDNLRTAIQIIFTTQIQVLTNMIGLIMDILKKAIDYNNKLISTTNRLPGH